MEVEPASESSRAGEPAHRQVRFDTRELGASRSAVAPAGGVWKDRRDEARMPRSRPVRLRAPAGARIVAADDSQPLENLQDDSNVIKLSPIDGASDGGSFKKRNSSPVDDDEPVMVDEVADDFGMQYGIRSNTKCDWRDNVSVRFGATFNDVLRQDSPGIGVLAEGSRQWHRTDLFMHAGIGVEDIEGEFPVSFTVGVDRLATIIDGRVVKPWIFSFGYDGYYDSEFFQTDDAVYVDQFRVLLGITCSPRIDVGVWSALSLQSDFGLYEPAPAVGPMGVRGRLADRIAAYASINSKFDPRIHLLVSAGWEEDPGNIFTESDLFLPLNGRTNLVISSGVSDGGTTDVFIGLEKALGWRRARGLFDRMHDPFEADLAGDPRTFRGGASGGNYRGALRMILPSRMRRGMFLDTL
jgi:hypothetical protein